MKTIQKTSEILIFWGRTIHSPAILGYHLGTRLLTKIDTRGTCALDKEPNAGRMARRTRELGLPDLFGDRWNPSHQNGDDLGMAQMAVKTLGALSFIITGYHCLSLQNRIGVYKIL
jgi:hypothetical protein